MATKSMPALGSYKALLLKHAPKPIRSESAYRRSLRLVDKLMRKANPSRAEDDLLELLTALVKQYEEQHFAAPDVAPGDIVAHLIEAQEITKAELARVTNIPRQTITNIVNGTRKISKTNRQRLANYFGVSPDLFSE